jgi:hypothetical protein
METILGDLKIIQEKHQLNLYNDIMRMCIRIDICLTMSGADTRQEYGSMANAQGYATKLTLNNLLYAWMKLGD